MAKIAPIPMATCNHGTLNGIAKFWRNTKYSSAITAKLMGKPHSRDLIPYSRLSKNSILWKPLGDIPTDFSIANSFCRKIIPVEMVLKILAIPMAEISAINT